MRDIFAVMLYLIIPVVLLIGEIKCFVKMLDCNWNPIGKSEVFYTIGTFTGTGCIIGYINIKDE